MSSCTKCGYPMGNYPFRHPFAPVVAEAPKPPAPESPYVPLVCGEVEALLRENAFLRADAARARAAEIKAGEWADETKSSFLDLRHALDEAGTRPFFTRPDGADRVLRAIECVRELRDQRDSARASIDVMLANGCRIRAEERERCAKVVETYSNSERATDLILAEIRNPKGAR